MEILKYGILSLILVMSFIQVINPRFLWKASRWQFKNPDANEPSKAGYIAFRLVGLLVFIVTTTMLITDAKF